MTRRKRKKIAETKEMSNVLENPEGMKGQWAGKYFNNSNPVVLELGCGKGEYTLSLAERYPDKNFIGIDVKGARLWKGGKIATEKGLSNAAFLRILIEEITEYFAPGEVTEIWVTFPDPYPKKSKAKKRLVSPRFLNLYREILTPGGVLHFKTDNGDLFEYGVETIKEEGWNILGVTRDLYDSELLDEITSIKTYYEQKFLAEGIAIKYLRAK